MAKSVTKEALEQMVTLQKGYIDKGDQQNSQAIEALETRVANNAERIAQNANDIANNAENIASKQPAIIASDDIAPLGANKLALTDKVKEGFVPQIAGKGLSTNDYTNEDKAKLTALPTKTELDSSLGAKLDKEKWEREYGQYTIKGYFLGKRGNVNASGTEDSGITPLLPLNKTYPIVLKNVRAYNTAVAVCFYDATGSFISYPEGIENLNGDFTVSVDKYPAGAYYFRACSEKAGSTYTNGPTQEAREGAVSEAIQASITAVVDEELDAQAAAIGAIHNYTTGYFEYNTLTDITAEQMRNILEWGAYERFINVCDCNVATATNNIPRLRTTIPSVSFLPYRSKTYPPLNWMPQGLEIIKLSVSGSDDPIFNLGNDLGLYDAPTLRGILDTLRPTISIRIGTPKYPTALSTLYIKELKFGIDLANLSALSLASLQYLVTNSANTDAITVTVHPDVYAKLTGDTSNAAAAALSADELAQWQALVATAAEKQITFATT